MRKGRLPRKIKTLKSAPMSKASEFGRGPTQRQLRVAELIRRAMSEALARGEVHDPELNAMSITVGEVTVSPDLKVATAYVLPLGGGDRDAAIAALKANKSELRRAMNKSLSLKFSPDLRFRIDDTFDRIDDARELFSREEVRRDVEGD